jgi:hypothetical protein
LVRFRDPDSYSTPVPWDLFEGRVEVAFAIDALMGPAILALGAWLLWSGKRRVGGGVLLAMALALGTSFAAILIRMTQAPRGREWVWLGLLLTQAVLAGWAAWLALRGRMQPEVDQPLHDEAGLV